MSGSPARLAVLVSGGGRSLENLCETIEAGELDARVALVLSNRADAYALERARRRELGAELEDLVAAHRFLVIRGGVPTQSDAVELLAQLGPINEASTRQDGAVIVEEADDDERVAS